MKNPYFSLLGTAWTFAGNKRKTYVLVYLMFFAANLVAALNPLVFGWFVNKVQTDTQQVLRYTLLYAGAYFGLKLLEWSLHGPGRVIERTLAFHIGRNFLEQRFHQTLHLPAQWHQDNHSGATINRLQKAYDALRGFFDKGFFYVHTLSKFVLSVTAILYFSPLFGSIAIVLGLINIAVISKFNKPYIRNTNLVHQKERNLAANLFDTLSNIRTVITLRLEKSMERGLAQKLRLVLPSFRKTVLVNEWKWFTAEMVVTLIYCVVVAGYVYQHWEPGKLFAIAGLLTLLGYVNQFTSVFQNVAGQYTEIMQFHTTLNNAAIIPEAYAANHRPDGPAALPADWQAMDLRNINFSYQTGWGKQKTAQHLRNLELRIERGQRIALIGESGCGKSTLLTLLRGLYTPEAGTRFQVDGKAVPMAHLYDSVTLFPQEPEIFENTIAYNITLGLPCSDADISEACRQAQFAPIVAQMPEGLQTDIKEKGVNLSGGQKQRLALARGILAARDSKLVLLDEPTSSVDPRTEVLIYDELFAAFRDKAIISSLHRMHLLPKFDYIYIMDKGRIVDEGSFDQLLLTSDAFKAMWAHQQTGMEVLHG
ncbi:ABC-type multidrug transport system, ATPase and permease component [Cnuella takakiae]|uniref:ABC-type multidrug transport system, ATPase and permease component n=1 Tax=Cnuella takakiae TaxID=1302690 RepID=A0A1M5CYA9_9BACT|nr:ABC transporter ATP-binding protein [Cnuella takakiae]OLY95009.1 ABC transporter [Cnuella takakiae]SHF59753.1 ABC-type multidrug transport system, ATPase and permease component [Cnuella takakiae]